MRTHLQLASAASLIIAAADAQAAPSAFRDRAALPFAAAELSNGNCAPPLPIASSPIRNALPARLA
jgi:hypothetical protein